MHSIIAEGERSIRSMLVSLELINMINYVFYIMCLFMLYTRTVSFQYSYQKVDNTVTKLPTHLSYEAEINF